MHTFLKHKHRVVEKLNDQIEHILDESGGEPLDEDEMEHFLDCINGLSEIADIVMHDHVMKHGSGHSGYAMGSAGAAPSSAHKPMMHSQEV